MGLSALQFAAQALALLASAGLILCRAVFHTAALLAASASVAIQRKAQRTFLGPDSQPLLKTGEPVPSEQAPLKSFDQTPMKRNSQSPAEDGQRALLAADAAQEPEASPSCRSPGNGGLNGLPAGGVDSALALPGISLFQGTLVHARVKPLAHRFSHPVRMALVNLDAPPLWFSSSSAATHMSAAQARAVAGTDGPVLLLTNPVSVGYEQNPISVYYCYTNGKVAAPSSSSMCPSPESLALCIAEVTNTPWNDRVTFTFAPGTDTVMKPLHVSPFMDMESEWRICAPAPSNSLQLTFRLHHPTMGSLFVAHLAMRNCTASVLPGPVPAPGRPRGGATSALDEEAAALAAQWFFWLMPHKVAFWIYWHALLLWWKGVPLFMHPKYESGADYRLCPLMGQATKDGRRPMSWINGKGVEAPGTEMDGSKQSAGPALQNSCSPAAHGGAVPQHIVPAAIEEMPSAKHDGTRVCFWSDATTWPWGVH